MNDPAPLDTTALHDRAGPRVIVLDRIDSTNAWLQQAADRQSGDAVLARQQTAGRGRAGRPWVSPRDASLYLSMYWAFQRGEALVGLSLAAGVAVRRALLEQGFSDVLLKWPNDVYVLERKLGGILVEATSDGDATHAVIGIGINGHLNRDDADAIDQPWTALERLRPSQWTLTDVAISVIQHLRRALREFAAAGLRPFLSEWLAADALAGREVQFGRDGRMSVGRYVGVDDEGALLIETATGLTRHLAGDVSVRAR